VIVTGELEHARVEAVIVLRILVLKHLNDWSFDECEQEVRGSLVYRAFCRIDGEYVPDASMSSAHRPRPPSRGGHGLCAARADGPCAGGKGARGREC
jgi:hypothetical protein